MPRGRSCGLSTYQQICGELQVSAYQRPGRLWFRTPSRDVWFNRGDPGVTFQADGIRFYRPVNGVFDMELGVGKRRRKPGSKWKLVKAMELEPNLLGLVLSLLTPTVK